MKHLFTLLALLPAITLCAQPIQRYSVNAGYMMTNNNSYADNNCPTYGLDAALLWPHATEQTLGQGWKQIAFGFKASFAAIPQGPAGHRMGLVGLLHFDLSRRWECQLGVGLSAYTKPYSFTHDTNNLFIGSFVNCLIDIGISYSLTRNLDVALRVLHTSNGMLYKPNQGLNYFQLDVAYTPRARSRIAGCQPEGPYTMRDRHELGLALSLGTVMSRKEGVEGYFPCYDLSLNYQYYVSPWFAVGGTVDLWYNFVDRQPLLDKADPYTFPMYLSALAGFEAFFGPVSIKAGIGPSILVSSEVSIPFYERVGVYYNFPQWRHYLGVALNAHAGRIEFIEWTVGFRM